MKDILEILKEYPTLKHQYEQMKSINCIRVLLPHNKREELKEMNANFEKLILDIETFNDNFSNYGWIAYSRINTKFMEKANKIFEEEGLEKAEEFISDYYIENSEEMKKYIQFSSEEFRIRRHLIDNAFEDYKNGKYYSAIPIFLTIADGVINDYTKNKGFFTEGVDLDCWDCLVECDKGLKKIKSIYNSARKKTTTYEIKIPYRNGILHGRDLNYGNKFVAGKCIVMLLAISEWIGSKKNEESRIEQHNKDINPPPITESIKRLKEIREDRVIIKKWKPAKIVIGKDIPISGKKEEYNRYEFIYVIIEMLEFWKEKNYGALSKKLEILFNNEKNINLRPKRCRELFEKNLLLDFELISIVDQAITMKVVEIKINIQKEKNTISGNMRFGIVYESESKVLALPEKNNGFWKIYPHDVCILY